MIDLSTFPEYFRKYEWSAKHALFGYPADRYREFRWIKDLESRAAWLRDEIVVGSEISGFYLVKDIIQWGGSQNGCLQKFEDGIGSICLREKIARVVASLAQPQAAISAAMDIPGLGLTYGSKLLRFLKPTCFGALDRRVRSALTAERPNAPLGTVMPEMSDYNAVPAYVWFCEFTSDLMHQLEVNGIARPECELIPNSTNTKWRAADVEMALFQWAATVKTKPSARD